jgi:hypothetical protein
MDIMDSNEIKASLDTHTGWVLKATTNDTYAWNNIEAFTIQVWNHPSMKRHGYEMEHKLGLFIQEQVSQSRPAFTHDLWTQVVESFLRNVSWRDLARWFIANCYERALIDQDMDEMQTASLRIVGGES